MDRDDAKLIDEIELVLTVYTLEDILDQNDLTTSEALLHLIKEGLVVLPEHKPVG